MDCNLSILKTKFFLFYEKRLMCIYIYIYAAGLKLQNTIYAAVFYIYIYI